MVFLQLTAGKFLLGKRSYKKRKTRIRDQAC